MFPNSIRLSR